MRDIDLRGRLEEVELSEKIGTISARGSVVNSRIPVTVTNGRDYVGQRCLVRFDFGTRGRRNPTGNFVSNVVPENFRGLRNADFFMYGVWTDEMTKAGRIPTMGEINRHYDPRNIYNLLYVGSGYRSSNCAIIVPNGFVWTSDVTQPRAIRDYLLNNRNGARLVIIAGEERAEKIINGLETRLHKIRATPLHCETHSTV